MPVMSWFVCFVTASLYSNLAGALAVALLLPVFWIYKKTATKVLFMAIIYYAICYFVTHAYSATLIPLFAFLGIHLPSPGKIVSTISATIVVIALGWFYLQVYAHFTQ